MGILSQMQTVKAETSLHVKAALSDLHYLQTQYIWKLNTEGRGSIEKS